MPFFIRGSRRVLLILSFLLTLGLMGAAHAAVPLMSVEEIQVGAQGIARTVISGTRIEEFGVEVLGIMKNKGAVGDLILVRTYGDVIERSGGVAQGMSGSPVYIDGRLIGAIGYGFSLTDQRTAMVTPIHDMLQLLDRMPVKAPEPTLGSIDKEELLATPLMAAGFGANALSFLQMKLKPLNLTPYTVGDPPPDIAYGELEPGSSVGVQLVRGDVSLGALGTVTYVDGDKVLAFGHPFLKRGQTGFLMTNAYVFTTIRGIESSFKVGSTGEVIGTISQDRGAGIAGEMNRYPGVVPMRMNIRAADTAQTKEMSVQMVQDEEIVPILATASLLNAIDKAIDRTGSGTANITFEISARGMPGETYKRENMFYSPENVAEASLAEFYEFVAFLTSNPHNPVTIMDIQADVSVSQERRTARILSARPVQLSAKPGEAIDIEVKLKPYRTEPITRTVSFTVPKDQVPGLLNLSVRGGGFFSLASLLKKLGAEGEVPKPTRKPPKSFDEMMKEFSGRDRNNDIVVELPNASDLLDEDAGGDKKLKLKLSETEKAAADKEPMKPEKTGKTKSLPSLLIARKPDHKNKGVVTT
ncbi:MAG TPA: SpoIVB peptidase S55 domain-containing protein, partial [Negativicutes bacterium]|nr:SpoIVB peptidase S55 domain-containing protein [Negativicutes bacterium]